MKQKTQIIIKGNDHTGVEDFTKAIKEGMPVPEAIEKYLKDNTDIEVTATILNKEEEEKVCCPKKKEEPQEDLVMKALDIFLIMRKKLESSLMSYIMDKMGHLFNKDKDKATSFIAENEGIALVFLIREMAIQLDKEYSDHVTKAKELWVLGASGDVIPERYSGDIKDITRYELQTQGFFRSEEEAWAVRLKLRRAIDHINEQ